MLFCARSQEVGLARGGRAKDSERQIMTRGRVRREVGGARLQEKGSKNAFMEWKEEGNGGEGEQSVRNRVNGGTGY